MNPTDDRPILVTGAAGQLGAVGRTVTGLLLARGLPVRAMVRRDDVRAAALRAAGADVVPGKLFAARRSGSPRPGPHPATVRARQDLSGFRRWCCPGSR